MDSYQIIKQHDLMLHEITMKYSISTEDLNKLLTDAYFIITDGDNPDFEDIIPEVDDDAMERNLT